MITAASQAAPPSQAASKTSSNTAPSKTAPSPTWELGLALAVNCIWIAAAVTGVVKLLPVRVEQTNRLEQAGSKVALLQNRVSLLQREVERGLDASQAEAEIAARLYHIPPERMQVQLIPNMPPATPPEGSAQPSTPLLLPDNIDAAHIAKVGRESEASPDESATKSEASDRKP